MPKTVAVRDEHLGAKGTLSVKGTPRAKASL
jgi:hypothetical protein